MGDARRPRQVSSRLARMWIVPQEGREQFMLFRALTEDGKEFMIGEGIGSIGEDGIKVSDVGGCVMTRLAKLSDPEREICFLELSHMDRIGHRLRLTFAEMPSGTAIMILCRNSAIIDGLLQFLEIQNPIIQDTRTFPPMHLSWGPERSA